MENQFITRSHQSPKILSPIKREALRDLVNLNTSGDQSQNNKAIDKTASKSKSSSDSKNNNGKVSDESSDSSLDYGSANEDSSPRDDSTSDVFSDIKYKTPKTEKGKQNAEILINLNASNATAYHDVINENAGDQKSGKHKRNTKQKVYNELTESFETPDNSIFDVSDVSTVISNTDSFEIGEDPLSLNDRQFLSSAFEERKAEQILEKSICEDSLNKSIISNQTLSVDSLDNETNSLCSNRDRESSVEVIKEDFQNSILEESFKSDNSQQYLNNSFKNNFNLPTSPSIVEVGNKILSNPIAEVNEKIEAFDLDDILDLDITSNVRRDSGASILVLNTTCNDLVDSKAEIPSDKKDLVEMLQNIPMNLNSFEKTICDIVVKTESNDNKELVVNVEQEVQKETPIVTNNDLQEKLQANAINDVVVCERNENAVSVCEQEISIDSSETNQIPVMTEESQSLSSINVDNIKAPEVCDKDIVKEVVSDAILTNGNLVNSEGTFHPLQNSDELELKNNHSAAVEVNISNNFKIENLPIDIQKDVSIKIDANDSIDEELKEFTELEKRVQSPICDVALQFSEIIQNDKIDQDVKIDENVAGPANNMSFCEPMDCDITYEAMDVSMANADGSILEQQRHQEQQQLLQQEYYIQRQEQEIVQEQVIQEKVQEQEQIVCEKGNQEESKESLQQQKELLVEEQRIQIPQEQQQKEVLQEQKEELLQEQETINQTQMLEEKQQEQEQIMREQQRVDIMQIQQDQQHKIEQEQQEKTNQEQILEDKQQNQVHIVYEQHEEVLQVQKDQQKKVEQEQQEKINQQQMLDDTQQEREQIVHEHQKEKALQVQLQQNNVEQRQQEIINQEQILADKQQEQEQMVHEHQNEKEVQVQLQQNKIEQEQHEKINQEQMLDDKQQEQEQMVHEHQNEKEIQVQLRQNKIEEEQQEKINQEQMLDDKQQEQKHEPELSKQTVKLDYDNIDDENPFATRSKLRNSSEKETIQPRKPTYSFDDSMDNPFVSRNKLRNSPDRSTGQINDSLNVSPKIETQQPIDTIKTCEKSPKMSPKKFIPPTNRKSLVTKKVTPQKPTNVNNNDVNGNGTENNIENSLSKVEKVSAVTSQPDVKIDEVDTNKNVKMNGNIAEKRLSKSPVKPAAMPQIDVQNVTDKFASPLSTAPQKKINKNLARISRPNLSPMSRSGDLMGLSPVAHVNSANSAAPALLDVSNDLLTGKEILPETKDFGDDTIDDDDFKVPAEELFKDPAAFDYLLTCGNTGSGAKAPTRDFGKESLFVKFDPLVGLPTGVRPGRETEVQPTSNSLTALNRVDEDASIASGLAESCSSDSSVSAFTAEGKTLSTMSSVEQSISALSIQTQSKEPLIASVPAIPQSINSNINLQSVDKPMQVVSPAKSVRQQYQPCTPPQVQSISKTTLPVSPAIAAIDRLINLGLNTPPPPPPVVIQPKEPEMDPQLINELHTVREMLSRQEQELQQSNERISSLQQQLTETSEREQNLIERVNEKNKNHRQMSVVMEEYEKTMSQLIGEREAEKRQWLEERATLISERDEASKHLASIEHSFNDIHAKYERCKTVIQTYKTNEDILKQTVAKNEENLKKQIERYEQLRQHAMSQLDKASQEIDSVKKASQAEIIKLQAMLKKSEIQISSLQESLAQKTKNCEELTSICDELINKVG